MGGRSGGPDGNRARWRAGVGQMRAVAIWGKGQGYLSGTHLLIWYHIPFTGTPSQIGETPTLMSHQSGIPYVFHSFNPDLDSLTWTSLT